MLFNLQWQLLRLWLVACERSSCFRVKIVSQLHIGIKWGSNLTSEYLDSTHFPHTSNTVAQLPFHVLIKPLIPPKSGDRSINGSCTCHHLMHQKWLLFTRKAEANENHNPAAHVDVFLFIYCTVAGPFGADACRGTSPLVCCSSCSWKLPRWIQSVFYLGVWFSFKPRWNDELK